MANEDNNQLEFSGIFSASFERLMARRDTDFIQAFYDLFIASSPKVAQVFNRTDMDRQAEMLRMSLTQMMAFAANRSANVYLQKVAAVHSELGISDELFRLWLQCLLQAVRDLDPHYDARVEMAWRVTMAPGLEFMRCYGELCR